MASFSPDTAGTLSTSLVSFWPLFTNSNDAFASNNGTDTNITYSSNKAVFNGSTSTITTSGTGFPTGAGARSISFWINFGSASGSQCAFGYGSNGAVDEAVDLYFNPPSSNTSVDIFGASANTNHSLAATTDYHFIFTYPGSGTAWTVYKNNDAGTSLDITVAPNTTTTAHKLGQLVYSTGFPLSNGTTMWESGIWSKVLSSTERSDLYNSGNGNFYGTHSTTTNKTLAALGVG